MTRQLILHIGSHKTGTTTLQRTLRTNKAVLAAAGWSYAHAENSDHVHQFLAYDPKAGMIPDGYRIPGLADLAKLIRETEGERVIVSSENFSFVFDPAEIARLQAALAPDFGDIRVICYLRRQDSHLVSHHQEGAKPRRWAEKQLYGNDPAALPPWRPELDLYLDYAARLAKWAAAFGADRIEPRIYARDRLAGADVVTDFLERLGIGTEELERFGNLNESLGFERAKVGHVLNAHVHNDELRSYLVNRLPNSGRRMLPSRAAALALYDHYRESNRRLNEMFKLSEGDDPFDDDFSMYPETPGDVWTDAEATEALGAMVEAIEHLLQGLTTNDLRDAAVRVEKADRKLAQKLMTVALRLRPNGHLIRKKIEEYAAQP